MKINLTENYSRQKILFCVSKPGVKGNDNIRILLNLTSAQQNHIRILGIGLGLA